MAKPLHSGPVLPLAIMAMFALMVPVFYAANYNNKIRRANAMRVTVPTNEPRYEDTELMMSPTPSVKPVKTPKPVKY